MGECERKLLAWGTCANEALHAQMKSAELQVVQQHADVLRTKMYAFALRRWLAHGSAAYSQTTRQLPRAILSAMLQGSVMSQFFKPSCDVYTEPVTTQKAARTAVIQPDIVKIAANKDARSKLAVQWAKHKAALAAKKKRFLTQNVARRQQVKMTVFTANKVDRLHRSPRCVMKRPAGVAPKKRSWEHSTRELAARMHAHELEVAAPFIGCAGCTMSDIVAIARLVPGMG